MADIQLLLDDNQYRIDVSQDRRFPLSLNYSTGTMQNIETRTADYSLEFRIPANKQNKSAMKHLESTNVLDSDDSILARTACTVLADGMPIFRGDFKLLGTTNDRGHEEFNCIILGAAMSWVEGMSTKTLRDYDWGTVTYDKATIEDYWYYKVFPSSPPTSRTAVSSKDDNGITFPLVCYGAWSGGNRVWEKDMRPAVFMRSLFEKAFTAEGYKLQTDTDADDFFHSTNNSIMDKIVFPFTGDGMISREADIELNTSEASQENQQKGWLIRETYSCILYNETTQGSNTVVDGLRNAGDRYDTDHCVRYWLLSETPNFRNILNENSVALVANAGGDLSADSRGNSYLNTPSGEVFEIIGYGKGTIRGFQKTYIDIRGIRGGQNRFSTFTGALSSVPRDMVLSILEPQIGDDNMAKINFDTTDNSTVFSTFNNEFTATEALNMKFDFNCEIAAYDNIGINQGIFDFHIIHEKASDGTVEIIGTSTTRTPQESNIEKTKRITRQVPIVGGAGYKQVTEELAVQEISVDSRNAELSAGDKVYVKVSFTPEQLDQVYIRFKDLKLNLYDYLEFLYIDKAKFVSTPLEDFANGASNVVIANILDDNWNVIEYIKGCIHAFNLMIKTNPLDKSVIIKTRDDFYKDNSQAIDWTDKIDLKKQYVIDYLDFYKRDVKFSFQTDNADGYLSELNTLSDYEYGAYEDQLYERFTEGKQSFQNPLFAYTHHRASRDLVIYNGTLWKQQNVPVGLYNNKLIHTARMWNQHVANSTPPQQYFKFRPRMLIYEYVNQFVFWNWGKENGYHHFVPTALPFDLDGKVPNFNHNLHLGYNDTEDKGLFSTYYNKTLNTIERGTRLTVPIKLKYRDISNLDLTKPIYISHPEKIRGYWFIDQITDFLPSAILSTTVQLVKIEDFDIREIDPNQRGQILADQKEWWKHMQEHLGGGRGGGISPHDRWTHKAHGAGVEMWGGGKMGNASAEGFLGNIGSGNGGHNGRWYGNQGGSGNSTSGSAMSPFDQYTPTNQDWTQEANADAKKGFWINQTNTAGAEEYDSSWKNQIIPYYNPGFAASNAVLSSYGNQSPSASGNLVSGSHNKAYGTNQMVAGQYANASPNLLFAIGAGSKETGSYNAFSIDRNGIMKQGEGYLVSEDGESIEDVYEIINGELTKIII